MKNKKTPVKLSAIALFSLITVCIGITSCHKNASSSSASTAAGTFYFRLHTNIDTNEISAGILYPDSSGRHFALTVPQFYISGVVLQASDGSLYTIPVYIIKTLDSISYMIGTAPVGTYTSVSFNVGIDPTTNTIAPANQLLGLVLDSSNMWFGNTSQGYIFMKVQGTADTSASQNGQNPVPFSYEIGSNNNLKTVTMPTRGAGAYASYQPYVLANNRIQYIDITCDYGKLLSVVNFKTQDSTDTYTVNPGLADTIANNIPNMFRYKD